MTVTYQSQAKALSPRWLRGTQAGALIGAIGAELDLLQSYAVAAIKARFPGLAPTDALALIGQDRRIPRREGETDADYAVRCQRWLDDRKYQGSPYATMRQVAEYIGHPTKIRVVNNAGVWHTLNADGTTERYVSSPSNWNWDNNGSSWSRFWVIVYPPIVSGAPLWGDDGTYGDGLSDYGDAGTIGTTVSEAEVAGILAVVREWGGRSHAKAMWIIVPMDPTSFDPSGSPGYPLPYGQWGEWLTAAAEAESSRLLTARYWSATPT